MNRKTNSEEQYQLHNLLPKLSFAKQSVTPPFLKRPATTMNARWLATQHLTAVVVALLGILLAALQAKAQTVDASFQGPLCVFRHAALPCPDGAVLLAASYWTMEGEEFYHLGRLHSNGAWDTGFGPNTAWPMALAIQTDGKILVQADSDLLRLNADGSFDRTFNVHTNLNMRSVALQPDGKIIVWGDFTRIAGQPCTNLARLNADGTLDSAFRAGADGALVLSVASLEDGRIYVAGIFTNLGGQPCTNLARLDSAGVLDPSFIPRAPGPFRAVLVQADGKVVLGGQVAPLARLNPDGTLDTGFQPPSSVSAPGRGLLLQADGKLLTQDWRYTVHRLKADGSEDTSFQWSTKGISSMALPSDGRILLLGEWDPLQRIDNTEPATQSLVFNGSTITWLRGGPSPEVTWVTFEGSTNGTDWVRLGEGRRIPGGWQLAGVQFPSDARIRARGCVPVLAAYEQQHQYVVEASIGSPFIFAQPADQTYYAGARAAVSAGVGGSEPLQYQWWFNSNSIPAGTYPLLSLGRVQPTNQGYYMLTVSNSYGSVTSRVARLTVLLPPPLPEISLREVNLTNGTIAFSWNALVGGQYQVEYTTNVAEGQWSALKVAVKDLSLSPSFGLENGIIRALGTNLALTQPVSTGPKHVYRVLTLPRSPD